VQPGHATGAIDVFIVAEVRLYRQGLTQALNDDPRFRVTGSAGDHAEALREMMRLESLPKVAILDTGLGAGRGGARRLHELLPEVHLVALAVEDTDESVVAWAEAGVAGFVTRDTSLDGLMNTVESVASGETQCSPRATAALLRRLAELSNGRGSGPRTAQLTPREREIVALIDRGLSNKQIARELHIELATVKNHVHSVLEKLQVDRRGAAAAAVRST
jgi:two-component system, NarL family, nitrate/nitrite response regulator NarL